MIPYNRLSDAIARRKPHESVFARDLDQGKKIFFTCTTEQLIRECNAAFQSGSKPLLLYECLTHACKFFMDIDHADIDPVLHWLHSVGRFGHTFRIYHAPPKLSYHIRGTIHSRVYADVRDLRAEIISTGLPLPPGVDLSVYSKNRLIRCIGSTKWGETRALVPWGPWGGGTLRLCMGDFINVPTQHDPEWGSPRVVRVPAGPAGTRVPKCISDHYYVYMDRSLATWNGESMNVYVNSRECAIAGRTHRSNKIFFMVDSTGIYQRCFKCTGSMPFCQNVHTHLQK